MTGKDIPLALDPKGDTEIKVPATIAYADLVPVLGSVIRRILSGQKTIPITIDAVFSGKPAIYSESGKELPISFEKIDQDRRYSSYAEAEQQGTVNTLMVERARNPDWNTFRSEIELLTFSVTGICLSGIFRYNGNVIANSIRFQIPQCRGAGLKKKAGQFII
jgi:hypothetical protein